ncbi:hypothetical protein [Ferruginibacter albus]|uniref:hypothetical protein n=1 Tax=Ferruginibacter albus TaxID=2875540 RepID=UPI001CC50B22|nr:hypothetical protein [Ferruginibacter albus]UAY53190.1 hypothetical protein K9M53_05840 [Ferruginibacter albus]
MQSFIQYWDSVDQSMIKIYGIDTSDAGISADDIAFAQEALMKPKEFVEWWGSKYDLTPISEYKINLGKSTRVLK